VVFSRCHRDVRGDASQPVGRCITRCLLVSRRTDSFRRCAQRPSDARTSSHTPFRTTRQQGSSSFVRRDHHARLRCAAPGRKEIILNTSVVSVSRMPPMPIRDSRRHGANAQIAPSRGYRLEAGEPEALFNLRLWDGTTATELCAMWCVGFHQDIRERGWAPASSGASDGIAAKRLKIKTRD
jgi:hypothetical protein